MRRHVVSSCLSLAAVVLAASSLAAQGLRVRVVDQSGAPIPAALVTLLRDGHPVGDAEGLTRSDGVRFFPADPRGRYALLVRRAGMEPFTSDVFAVPHDTAAVSIAVPARPLALRSDLDRSAAAPSAMIARECRPERASPPMARLRDQVWTVVRSAQIAAADGLEPIAIRRVERTLDRDGTARDETVMDGSALGSRLFRSAAPAELSRRGFAYTDSLSGQPGFLGPDLPYLASREFQVEHCFAMVAGRDATAGMVGLAFARAGVGGSANVRGNVHMAGTFWVDLDAGELRVLEFTYAGGSLPPNSTQGRIAFERLPSGIWIARDWSLRVPVLTQAGQLLGFREEIGEALQVSPVMLAMADSIANSRKPPGRVFGVVMDSLLTRPLADAVVQINAGGPRARTDSSGTFSIRAVPAGYHRISVTHPMLDSIGTRPPARMIRVGADSTTHVNLGGPTLATLKGGACHDSLAVLTGLVRDVESGQPLDTARVTLSWIEIVFQPGQPLVVNPVELTVYSDSSGRYAACVPTRPEITVHAQLGDTRTGRVDVRIDERRLGAVYLSMDRSTADTLVGSAAIQGVVLYQDRTPLANATVTLTDPERTVVTDSAGWFRIASIPGGTRVLDARALGHAPVRTVVEARANDTTVTRIFMRRVTQLDAVVVRASAGAGSRALVELEERRRRGMGQRLTPLELLAFKHSRMDAVMRALPFVQVRWVGGGSRVLMTSRGNRMCTPNVWIDGNRSSTDVLNDYPAAGILAVELFRTASEVPTRYRTANDCGAILLWTRERAGG